MTRLPPDGSLLDPDDWAEFRSQAHRLVDACVDRLEHAGDLPWRPVAPEALETITLELVGHGESYEQLTDDLIQAVMPFATGNTHPRFFGWVHGTGLAAGLLAEMVAATMNSNCGGRDHGAVYVEREVIDWCKRAFSFPESSSGVLVTGTSQATVLALACARQRSLGDGSRFDGIQGGPRLVAYAAEGVHNAVIKACELLGLGSAALREIPCDTSGSLDTRLLRSAIETDRLGSLRPFAVVGTAGSVNLGAFDRLEELADLCAAESLWFHVDGAFGAWLRIVDEPWTDRVRGIERADSIAFDFHKWMFVPYDCGAVLVRDAAAHRAAFAVRPAYLASHTEGLGGGDPWFCDYGIDLSRGFRALKVWAALKAHGRAGLAAAISRCCSLAARMGERVHRSSCLTLVAPVRSAICCFTAAPQTLTGPQQDALNLDIAKDLQTSGDAVFSTTVIAGRTVLRAAIANHRTMERDVDFAIEAVERARQRLLT